MMIGVFLFCTMLLVITKSIEQIRSVGWLLRIMIGINGFYLMMYIWEKTKTSTPGEHDRLH